jgi:hypothetical protein
MGNWLLIKQAIILDIPILAYKQTRLVAPIITGNAPRTRSQRHYRPGEVEAL